MSLHSDIEEIVFDEFQLKKTVCDMAQKINSDYKDKSLVVVGILKGSVMFLADLFRKLTIKDCTLDFMAASSYGSQTISSGNVKITKDISSDIAGKNVLIVEDILDTGNTLAYIKEYLLSKNALSVKICTLFDKPCRRIAPITPDYCGETVDDLFIVGYGLDYDERYRNLPYVGVLRTGAANENIKIKE